MHEEHSGVLKKETPFILLFLIALIKKRSFSFFFLIDFIVLEQLTIAQD